MPGHRPRHAYTHAHTTTHRYIHICKIKEFLSRGLGPSFCGFRPFIRAGKVGILRVLVLLALFGPSVPGWDADLARLSRIRSGELAGMIDVGGGLAISGTSGGFPEVLGQFQESTTMERRKGRLRVVRQKHLHAGHFESRENPPVEHGDLVGRQSEEGGQAAVRRVEYDH
jgi:hypothetical protein